MSNAILVIGESGTGKSTSLESLDPKETFIIQVVKKPLPFRGGKKLYSVEKNNLKVTDDSEKILETISNISKKGLHVKTVVIDDASYIMSNALLRRALEKGYDKFSQIGQSFFNVLENIGMYRDDLNIIFFAHSETKDDGKVGIKTSGKMLDQQYNIAGLFTTVFETVVSDGNYSFLTQNNGANSCKSPKGMFAERLIPNEMQFVIDEMDKYYNGEEETTETTKQGTK